MAKVFSALSAERQVQIWYGQIKYTNKEIHLVRKVNWAKAFVAIGLGFLAVGILDKCIFHIPYLAAFAFGLTFGFMLLALFVSDSSENGKGEKVNV